MKSQNTDEAADSAVAAAVPCSAWLDDADAKLIIEAAVATGPKTEDEIVKILEWAESIRCGSCMLEMVLEGSIYVALSPAGEVAFTAPPNETSPSVDAKEMKS